MKKEILLKIIAYAKNLVIQYRHDVKNYEGLCFILNNATRNIMNHTRDYKIVKELFLEFYNQKFSDNKICTDMYFTYDKEKLYGISSLSDWLGVSGGTHTQEYLDKWWECRENLDTWYDSRENFLKDWETAIIDGEFQSEHLSD
jgi:hypothetical protein